MKKLMLLAAVAIGYVLGARAGRQRYDQIMGLVNGIKNNPRVQATAHQAMDTAKEQAPVVADKVTQAAAAAASKVTGHTPSNGRHHMAGPQGDLP
ncbi:MAG TPA: hypothetical protein VFI40_02940 [Nocardioides sp.]|nr:hypothetical protein [Nocardioides sp.]